MVQAQTRGGVKRDNAMNVDMTDLFILKTKLFFRLTFVLVNKTIMSCVNNTIMSFVNNKTLNSIDMVGAPTSSNFLDQQKKIKIR